MKDHGFSDDDYHSLEHNCVALGLDNIQNIFHLICHELFTLLWSQWRILDDLAPESALCHFISQVSIVFGPITSM